MGAAACFAAALTVTGCGGPEPVAVPAPQPEGADARACGALLDALPEDVADQPRRAVEPTGAFAAAWGDPAIVLTCGGPMPPGFDDFASCTEVEGVGWFVAPNESDGLDLTTIGRAQNVHVSIPPEQLPPAAAMVDLAEAIRTTVDEVRACV